ncbi:MAG TPA: EVE domain-containing protein [Bacillales bacterium]|nr:EVE domain-containing protein [Bacillales bacterium]
MRRERDKHVWFMVASDTAEAFRWEPFLRDKQTTFWWIRRLPRNFKAAAEEDLILCYRSGAVKRGLVGIAEVEQSFNDDGISVRGLCAFKRMIPYEAFKEHPLYLTTEAGRLRNRGTLFSVDRPFAEWVSTVLTANGDWQAARCLTDFIK